MSEPFSEDTVDRGLEGVKVCSTRLSTIRNSHLYLRGYSLEDIAENASFAEVAYLLLKGGLPSEEQLKNWEENLGQRLFLDESLPFADLPSKSVRPMAWLRTAVSLIGLKEEGNVDFHADPKALEQASLNLIAKTPLLISFFHRQRQGLKAHPPKKDKSLSWNFLYTLTGREPETGHVRVLDLCLALHADHGLNCSTFSSRVTSSSLSDVYSAIVSAIGTLKGPLHGGANEKVMDMLEKFSSVSQAEKFIDEALSKKEKIMGFGHRVYKSQDPRAVLLKTASKKLTKEKGKETLFLISEAIEQKVKSEKNLCANVDFYSASVYHCLGIPKDLFTPVFVMSRMPGWLAHIAEQYSKNRIYRPSSLWLGETDKTWRDIEER